MKNPLIALFAAMLAIIVLADVMPSGCGRKYERPTPPQEPTPPPAGETTFISGAALPLS
ncbi:MAG: hypothetical protein KA152_06025 [Verrucomicrobiales bacterium]|nr:hypothetical protein [Verrucomicrobiales bacterium]HQW28366.1 hypothetical protein [Verrucomicrobiales bacterium]